MSGTCNSSPRLLSNCDFGWKWKKRGRTASVPDLAWKSQTSVSQTSATGLLVVELPEHVDVGYSSS